MATPHAYRFEKVGSDSCNLCGQIAKLVWVPIPPHGFGVKSSASLLIELGKKWPDKDDSPNERSALAYRTVCARCLRRMESQDQYLRGLGKAIQKAFPFWEAGSQPTAFVAEQLEVLLTSLLSKVIAAKIRGADSSVDKLRDIILSRITADDLSSAGISVHAWLHPFRSAVVARDFRFRDSVNNIQSPTVHIVKFFPIAYLVSEGPMKLPFACLSKLLAERATEVGMSPRLIMPAHWPERPERLRRVIGDEAYLDAASTVGGRFHKGASASSAVETRM